jgi:Holliday junction resolvasome RuvABC endonuclease subunit
MTDLTLFDTKTPAAGPTPRPAAGTTRPLVVGLDLSLTCTGIAGTGWTDHVRTKLRGDHRLGYLVDTIGSFIRSADMVVMEGPSYGHANLGGHEELAGLRCAIRLWCHRRDIPYGVVPPSSLKLYATGYGRASKGEIRSAIADRYGVETEGAARYDEADAYTALAMGLHHLGYPLADVPERNAKALDGCVWPEFVAVAR